LFDKSIAVTDEYTKLPCLHLLYHELRLERSSYTYALAAAAFELHADWVAAKDKEENPDVSVALTFDDGHASDVEFALPILKARGLRGRFFITAGWIGCKPGYMHWSDVRALCDAGHMIGAHGWSHALLNNCSAKELDVELQQAKAVIEDKTGIAVTSMSLPGGRSNKRVKAACREAGYVRVYTSEPRVQIDAAEFAVGRVNINSHVTVDWLNRLVQPGNRELKQLQTRHRIKEAAKATLGDRIYDKLWSAVVGKESDRYTGNIGPQ